MDPGSASKYLSIITKKWFLSSRKQFCGSGAFLTLDPGYRMGRKSVFLGFKIINSLMRIRDPGWRQFGSVMETVLIRDGDSSDPGWKKV
jgi:hypothetical protein